MTQAFTLHIVFGLDPMWVSATVLALTYALIISGRLNRAVVALIGAALVIIVGALDENEAIAGIRRRRLWPEPKAISAKQSC